MNAITNTLQDLRGSSVQQPTAKASEAAREFESLILAEMMKAGAKPMFGEHPLDGGSAGRMAREQHFTQLAALASGGGGFGLARQIERAIEREQK